MPSVEHADSKLHTRTMWLFADTAKPPNVVSPDNLAPNPDEKTGETAVVPDQLNTAGLTKEFSEEYEVIEPIGEGAICNVYAVRNKGLDRCFALKVLKEELTSNKAAVNQFQKEIDAAVALTHVNVAAVYGHGRTESGAPFVVQHLCEGKSLAEILKAEGHLKPERAINLLSQICDAMSHAHIKTVVHRDLKPSNVVVSRGADGEMVHLIDFGMSSVLQAARSAVVDVTRTGEIFGTPHYMSPEQCLGEKVDGRADVYSFGCLMYEVLNGRPPFMGLNPVQVICGHLKKEPPQFDVWPLALPHEQADSSRDEAAIESEAQKLKQLERIVMRCLKKDALARYQSFDEIKIDLEKVLSGEVLRDEEKNAVFPSPIRRIVAAAMDGLLLGALLCGFLRLVEVCLGIAIVTHVLWLSPIIIMTVAPIIMLVLITSPEFLMFCGVATLAFPTVHLFALLCLYPIIGGLYHAVCQRSKLKATLGAKYAGLELVDSRGDRLTVLHSILRFCLQPLLPCCAVTERIISGQPIFNKYNPLDRLSQSYVVTKGSSNLISMRGIQFPSPIPTTLVRLYHASKLVRWQLIGFISAVFFLAVCSLTAMSPAPVGVFVVVSLPIVTLLLYQRELLIAKRRVLGGRAEQPSRLSFTELFLRSLGSEKTQTKDS